MQVTEQTYTPLDRLERATAPAPERWMPADDVAAVNPATSVNTKFSAGVFLQRVENSLGDRRSRMAMVGRPHLTRSRSLLH